MYFNKDLCLVNVDVGSQKELFQLMYEQLYDAGNVESTFLNGIQTREIEYPTGIQIGGFGFAIPHTDSIHVKESQICVASLAKPILFGDMIDAATKINVNLVVMIAMASPHEQVDTLQNIMSLFQDEKVVEKIMASNSKKEIVKLIKEFGIL